ncbi:acyl-CoA carboxylase subunit epsilon [Streptacidiphilus neutrinimicus]|uniref:acyl-CoA carboxylase subunit epsilon n=1 Tax=Streptacidiphilus neutrinimicus TaxID=105420 RepID=UPI0013765F56|nr:acyl-CoA carboxylase subunit epsilon [Streptacidiphilus neutrinimicus]
MTTEGAQEWFTVVRGEPDPTELAVIAAVLLGIAARTAVSDGPVRAGGGRRRSRWGASNPYRGPSSWE